ncbi:hypothetical protein BH23GEM8_BH23GEM8_17010 [soil metagenome]
MSEHFGIVINSPRSGNGCSSAELVQDFLLYSGDLEAEEAARIAGVSTATLSRWRMMGARQLRAEVRSRLEIYLRKLEAERKKLHAA